MQVCIIYVCFLYICCCHHIHEIELYLCITIFFLAGASRPTPTQRNSHMNLHIELLIHYFMSNISYITVYNLRNSHEGNSVLMILMYKREIKRQRNIQMIVMKVM